MNEWKAPGKKTVIRCAVNRRQVVIALSGGELVYFEMDPVRFLFIIYFNTASKRPTIKSEFFSYEYMCYFFYLDTVWPAQ